MNYYIYIIKNKCNNKIYIGKRKCPINKTPMTDSYMGSGSVLIRAFKKYGKEQFEKTILIEGVNNVESINALEKEFIGKYDATNKKKGYNRTVGGDGGDTRRFFNEEQLEKYKSKFKGKSPSIETRQKLREKVNIDVVKLNLVKARERYIELIKSGWRQPITDQTRLKMSKSQIGKKVKRVMCIETGVIYDSMGDAANQTQSSLSKLSMCCHGKRNKTNGLHWKFI